MPDLFLIYEIGGEVKEGPKVEEYTVPLYGQHPEVETGAKVKAGQTLAAALEENRGDAHAPVAGEVVEVMPEHVKIKASEGENAPSVKLDGGPEELKVALSKLGFDSSNLKPAGTLVVNGMNPEPLVTVPSVLLRDHAETVKAGLEVVRRIVNPTEVILAVMRGQEASLNGTTVKTVNPVYPNSVDELAVKAVTGNPKTEDVAVIGVDELYNIGVSAKTGRPFIDKVMTINSQNYRVKIGTPAGELLGLLGTTPADGDRLLFGGPMRGAAQYTTAAPVQKNTAALYTIKKGEYPPFTPEACINCGECTRTCPARLQASLLGRYAEFGLFEEAQKLDVDLCVECGMCAYVCPAGRPMLQYMRFAKVELDKIRACLEAAETEVKCDDEKKECEEVKTVSCEGDDKKKDAANE